MSSDEVEHADPSWPPEPVPASDPNYVKHVRCDGARWHVIWWSTQGTHCSEPNCIINKDRKP